MTDNYIFQTYLPLIADLACFFVWFSMLSKMLTFRKERRWLFFTAIGINTIIAVICRSNPILLTSPIKSLFIIAIFLIYLFLGYKETIAQKLIAFALWIVTITVADMMAVVAISFFIVFSFYFVFYLFCNVVALRHCERSEAIQTNAGSLDCFVVPPRKSPIRRREASQ